MLLAEINGTPATTHLAARLFVEEGFAITAMGLQARPDRRQLSAFTVDGTAIAVPVPGGYAMADRITGRDDIERDDIEREDMPQQDETSETERERVRSSNDRDQDLEREGVESRHNRGYDETVKGQRNDVDPDSANAEIDRDDTIDEP